MTRHFVQISDFSGDELRHLLRMSSDMKALFRNGGRDACLPGSTAAMLFEKPSARTRISFEVAMTQLGGSALYLRQEDIGGLDKREPIRDLVRVLNGYVNAIIARTFAHETVLELVRYAQVPVINALTDLTHPCQSMADMLTIQEHCGRLEGVRLAYIGDGNNMARSLAAASALLGLQAVLVCPADYGLEPTSVRKLDALGPGTVEVSDDPREGLAGADVVYTDTWVSMGQEAEAQQRLADFAGFTLDQALLDCAAAGAKVMHCLPAYRGKEITDEVLESPQSIVFDQAENRLHFQRTLLKHLLSNP